MKSRLIRFIALFSGGLAVLVAVFVYAPLPFLEASPVDTARALDNEERTHAKFELIESGRSLDQPFPAMMMRRENPTTPERVELGRLLYFDPIVSGDNQQSCATCHHPDLGFSDGRGTSMGFGGQGIGPQRVGGHDLPRGSPTIWNAAYNGSQFWDGRATDLEDQAQNPIAADAEMGQDRDELVEELRAVPEYVERFAGAFDGDGAAAITFENVTFAIAAFERTIVTHDSRYDKYAAGDKGALTESERRGLNLFRSLKTRCFECHNLPTFANPDFKIIGVPELDGQEFDPGRGKFDGPDYDGAFKVPTLRNVALTAPYMHNGKLSTLAEVVEFYADGGGLKFGKTGLDDKIRKFHLKNKERRDLVAFLEALTDESALPEVPTAVPSGLPVIERLGDAARRAPPPPDAPTVAVDVPRDAEGHLLIASGSGLKIQDGLDAAKPGDTVKVMPGIYHETLSFDAHEVTLIGVEVDGERPVLDGEKRLTDAMVGVGHDLEIRGFDIRNYTSNGVMLNLSTDVRFIDLKLDDTGLYGVYPVESVGVLVENCTVTGARDAGIYVGQSKDVIVKDCVAHANVTGIEIENCIDAIVEGCDVYDNAGGVLVFLLPNNPSKLSQRCVVRNNKIHDNNHFNFADPNATVANVPSGTGVMLLAADDVEVVDNEITGNKTVGVVVLALDNLFDAFDVDPIPERNVVHGNVLANNGTDIDAKAVRQGFPEGADLMWDLSGVGHGFDQPGATTFPPSLPAPDWGDFRRRANQRFWTLLMKAFG